MLYPNLRNRFSVANEWLNGGRPDWVSTTDPTDIHNVSTGCGTLFLNYLAYQLGFEWSDIIAAAAPTLASTATNLGVLGMASGRASLPAGQNGRFAIFTSLAGATLEHWLLGSQALFGASVEPRAGETVRLYADPGTLVTLRFDRDGTMGTASASMSISGRLIDL
ncbi:MAG: hypothetical protein NVSMB32_06810 [Actinomycetota bacterium]